MNCKHPNPTVYPSGLVRCLICGVKLKAAKPSPAEAKQEEAPPENQ